jgi:hypothetical protein
LSDQFGNTVDREVWVPLTADSWLNDRPIGIDVGVGKGRFDYVFHTPTTSMEYALAFADGMLDGEGVHTNEGEARQRLMTIRRELQVYHIPEDHWPILMEREVSITRSSWKPMNV